MRGTKALRPRTLAVAAALGAFAVSASPPPALAAVGDLDARVKALEERIAKLEKSLAERDAEIARLLGELEARDAPRWQAPHGPRPDELMERWRDQFGGLDENMRREIERWGMDWGLPGRSFRNVPGPIEIHPARRAFLGIEMEEGDRGVQVARVVPGSPAEKAGVRPGDVMVEIDGRAVFSAAEVVRVVGSRRPGDALTVTVERDGETLNLSATLAAPSGGGGGFRMPEFRFGPFRPGRGREPAEDNAPAARDTIEVEVPVPGGRARVSFSAPGLFLSEALAERLDLTERERRDVEDALAEAREGLAKGLADEFGEAGGRVETSAVARLRQEAEKRARELLVGKLPEGELSALERAQAEAAAHSSVSVSMRSSIGAGDADEDGRKGEDGPADEDDRGEMRIEDSLEKLFERAKEF